MPTAKAKSQTKMRNFRKLDIWKNGIRLVSDVYQLATMLPEDEMYGLKSQICRAVVSVPSNIAEGSSRHSEIEFKRFLEIAMGSLFELETQLTLIQDLNLVSVEKVEPLIKFIHQEQKMINNLVTKIKASSQRPKAKSQQQ